MRTAFDQQLDALTAAIAEMCALAGRAMRDATQALLQADAALAERVIDEHDKIMLNGARAEQDAFALLALQVLVAGDLRAVVASLKNVADAERMGVLALHVAQIVRRCHPAHALPEEVNGYFAEMGRIAVDLGNNAKDVVQSGDPRKAAQLRHDDDAMDDQRRGRRPGRAAAGAAGAAGNRRINIGLLADLVLPAGGGRTGRAAGQRPGGEERPRTP